MHNLVTDDSLMNQLAKSFDTSLSSSTVYFAIGYSAHNCNKNQIGLRNVLTEHLMMASNVL